MWDAFKAKVALDALRGDKTIQVIAAKDQAYPDQVWCLGITAIPVKHSFLYLVAVMDWATRKVLSWRLSNTMHADFFVEAL